MTHTSTEQPEARRLADKYEIEGFLQDHRFAQDHWCRQAAAELRRQHARIEELEEQLSAIGAGGVEPLRKQAVPETLVVPDGYALMPIEPTAGICKAAADGWLDCGSKMVLNKAGAAYRSSVAYFMKKGVQS